MKLHGQDAAATGEVRQCLKTVLLAVVSKTNQYVQLDILNPYTVELLNSLPSLSTERGVGMEEIAGDVPEVADVQPGCRFHPRCPHAFDKLRGQARAKGGSRTAPTTKTRVVPGDDGVRRISAGESTSGCLSCGRMQATPLQGGSDCDVSAR